LQLVAGGWFVLREKYCWLVVDKPSEQDPHLECTMGVLRGFDTKQLSFFVLHAVFLVARYS
jgi:hypothetical protein